MKLPFDRRYGDALKDALFHSLIILALSLCILDFYQTAILCELSILLYWLFALVCVVRRPMNPTNVDLRILWYGLWPFVICFNVAVHVVWKLRGLE